MSRFPSPMLEAICDACLETTSAEGRPDLSYAIHQHALAVHRPARGTVTIRFTVVAEDGYSPRLETWSACVGALSPAQRERLASVDALIARFRTGGEPASTARPVVRARPEGVVA